MALRPSLLERAIRAAGVRGVHDALSPELREQLRYSWHAKARPIGRTPSGEWTGQLPPPGDWGTWLFLAGRRSGKTWTGAHWINEYDPSTDDSPIAIVGRTSKEARQVQVFGPSGIIALAPPWNRPRWNQTEQSLTWPDGRTGFLYTAEEPDALRGREHGRYWADELCAWAYQETFDMLLMTMSGGKEPKGLITTTPAPSQILEDVLKDEGTQITRGTTYDNLSNLPGKYVKQLLRKYEGTALGRQELLAELATDVEGAVWTRKLIDPNRVRESSEHRHHPAGVELDRVVVAVDPSGLTWGAAHDRAPSSKAALAGIVVVGAVDPVGDEPAHAYVLADLSCPSSPKVWGQTIVDAFHEFDADEVVYESTHGGAKDVEDVLRDLAPDLPLVGVAAKRGKRARAVPVKGLYEQGRVHHVAGQARPTSEGERTLAYLEDQMCGWTPASRVSPDRMDALVYGVTRLLVQEGGGLIW